MHASAIPHLLEVFARVPCLKLLWSRCRFQHAAWPRVNVSLHPRLAGFGGVSSAPSAVCLAPKGWRIWAPWCLDVKGLGATTSSLSWEKGLIMHVPTFAHMHANIHTHDACTCVEARLLQCACVSMSQDDHNMTTRHPNMATQTKIPPN